MNTFMNSPECSFLTQHQMRTTPDYMQQMALPRFFLALFDSSIMTANQMQKYVIFVDTE
jgi:hypothetical protein